MFSVRQHIRDRCLINNKWMSVILNMRILNLDTYQRGKFWFIKEENNSYFMIYILWICTNLKCISISLYLTPLIVLLSIFLKINFILVTYIFRILKIIKHVICNKCYYGILNQALIVCNQDLYNCITELFYSYDDKTSIVKIRNFSIFSTYIFY